MVEIQNTCMSINCLYIANFVSKHDHIDQVNTVFIAVSLGSVPTGCVDI